MPELSLPAWNTPCQRWTSLHVQSVMLHPHSSPARQSFLAVTTYEWLLEEEARGNTTLATMIRAQCIEAMGGLKSLLQSPSDQDVHDQARRASYGGVVAGTILALIWLTTQPSGIDLYTAMMPAGSPQKAVSPDSVNKAAHVLEILFEQCRGWDGASLARNRTSIRKAWSAYKSVAHLWAPMSLTSTTQLVYYEYPSLQSAFQFTLFSNLPGFLAQAELLRKFGQSYVPHGQPHPLLSPDETWRVPETVLLPAPFLEPLPFSWNILDTAKTYIAPKRL